MCDPSTGFSLLPSEKNCAGGRPKGKGKGVCGPTTTDDLWPSSRRHRPSLRPSVRPSECLSRHLYCLCLPTWLYFHNHMPPKSPPSPPDAAGQ